MTFEFKYKTESINFLSTKALNINSFLELDEFLKDGEHLIHLIIDEITNNKYYFNYDSYLEYLNDYKIQLWGFFLKESFQYKTIKTVEYNLSTYYNDYQKYNNLSNLDEYHTIYDLFKNNLDQSAKNSFGHLFSLKDHNTYRKIGELPYTTYSSDHLTNFIKIIEKAGNLDRLHWYIENYSDPHFINDHIIRPTYYKILLICTEEIRTNFLWIIIGYIITQIKMIESLERRIEDYFKDPNDYIQISGDLRDKLGVIGNNNLWLGVRMTNPKTGIEKLDTTKTAILALIDCLETKQYLKSNSSTALGLAFCKAFSIDLKERALRHTPKNHQLYFDFFSKGIPPRTN